MELARAAWIASFPGFKMWHFPTEGQTFQSGLMGPFFPTGLSILLPPSHLPPPLFKLLQLQMPSKALQLQQGSSCWGESQGFYHPC